MFFVFEEKKHWKTTLLVPYVCLKALFFAGSIIGFDPYPYTYIMHIFCYIKSLKCQPEPWLMINYHSRVQACDALAIAYISIKVGSFFPISRSSSLPLPLSPCIITYITYSLDSWLTKWPWLLVHPTMTVQDTIFCCSNSLISLPRMDVGRATYPSLSWRYRGARPTCMNHSKTETS